MNAWRIIWNEFYSGSSRRRVAMEMWRLSSFSQRLLILALLVLLFVAFFFYLKDGGHNWLSLYAATAAEVLLLLVLDKVKEGTFFFEYGRPDDAMVPPDNEEHRVSRYMLFRKRLREKNITKSHVEDAFPLVEAKLDLEASRGGMSKKYLGFIVGLVAGSLVSWSAKLGGLELAVGIAALSVVSFFVVMILSVIPSRTERLNELKYFMLLYCREVAS